MERYAKVAAVLRIAHRHGGVITAAQAVPCGASRATMASLARAGILVRRHPDVYAVAGTEGDHAVACRAALASLATRRATAGAVVSHTSAAWLQGLIPRPPAVVHVTVATAHPLSPAGVAVHRCVTPPPGRPWQGIRCTDPALTLVDLAVTAEPTDLDAAVDLALAKRIVRVGDLMTAAQSTRRRGAARLRRSLEDHGYVGAPTPSVLEARTNRLIRRAGLPTPRAEVVAGPDAEYRLDYAFPDRRLAFEVSGYAWHHSPQQMGRDLARHRRLVLTGWTVVSFTWTDVVERPEQVTADVRALAATSPPIASRSRPTVTDAETPKS